MPVTSKTVSMHMSKVRLFRLTQMRLPRVAVLQAHLHNANALSNSIRCSHHSAARMRYMMASEFRSSLIESLMVTMEQSLPMVRQARARRTLWRVRMLGQVASHRHALVKKVKASASHSVVSCNYSPELKR